MAQLSAQLSTEAFNSTSTPLGPGGTFLPAQFEDVSSWNTVTSAVVADAPSSASGLVFEWSADGITVDISIPFTLATMVPRIYDSAILMKFFRVNFTNGAFAQTRFNILTVYRYSSSVILRDIQDGEGDSIMSHPSNSERVSLVDLTAGLDIMGTGAIGTGVWADYNPFGFPQALNTSILGNTLSLTDNISDTQFSAQIDFFLRQLAYTCFPFLYNGQISASWDRQRNNEEIVLLFPTTSGVAVSSPDQTNYNARGIRLFWDITAIAAGQTLTLTVEVKDFFSGAYVTILTSAAIAATGLNSLVVYPGVTPVANVAASDILSRTFRVTVTPAGAAGNSTYSVYAAMML